MLIEKIELENFMCYAGVNEMTFKEGLNVIIGDNGYGKSKLYDAFHWVMFDRIFSSELKDYIDTSFHKENLISDKVKNEASDGDKIRTKVKLMFRDKERDISYIVQREYKARKENGRIIGDNTSTRTINKKSHGEAYFFDNQLAQEQEIAKIIRPDAKDYLWFQGEQVESIIDFNKQDTLINAINVLSNITRYDELKEIAIAAAKAVNNEFNKEAKRKSKDKDRSSQLETQKAELEEKIADFQEQERQVNDNLSIAETRCDELLNKQADAQKVNEFLERKRGIEALLRRINESLRDEQIGFHRKMFRNKWILKGTSDLYESYAHKFSNYEKKKLQLEAEKIAKEKIENQTESKLQTRLPFNVPEPHYIEWMLKEEKCLVCNREAKKDSEAWITIQGLLERPDKSKSKDDEPITLQNFSDDFKRLNQNGLSLQNRISEIDDDINETLEKRQKLIDDVRNTKKELEMVEIEIQKLLADTSLTNVEASNILNEYSVQNENSKRFSNDLSTITHNIKYYQDLLKKINDELNSLVTGEISKVLIEKKNVLNDFEEIAKTTRERVFTNLIAQLEKEANKHYEAMTSGHKSVRGKIKLKKLRNNNYMPEIINDNGSKLLGSNTSNLILVKLSTIMAIISAKSKSGMVDLYTLITDAPTSVFGEDYTIGFCKTISKVYKQSIIMSKEFYKNIDLRNELLTNTEINIGKVYEITPSISESERTNRDNLSTNIVGLN